MRNIEKSCASDASGSDAGAGANPDELMALRRALVVVAHQAWRMGCVAIDAETKEPKEALSTLEIKRIASALENLAEILGELEIKTMDRVGEPFNAGLPEQVVTEEPQSGISQERIIRTIRPTILWKQTMVQRGEIDIAVPKAEK